MNSDIVSVVTPVGEIVGRLKHESSEIVRLENPRSVMLAEGGAGFAPGISMTGAKNPAEVEINRAHIVFITPAGESVQKVWQQQTSGIVLS